MATLKRFEELEIWQLAREINLEIHRFNNSIKFRNRFVLKKQMERSAGSIMDNIAEGFERGGTKEFINFLGIAKASCGELRSQIYRAYDQKLIALKDFDLIMEKTVIESRKISSFIAYLSRLNHRGIKYKGNNNKPKT